jgi:hypothetical protein
MSRCDHDEHPAACSLRTVTTVIQLTQSCLSMSVDLQIECGFVNREVFRHSLSTSVVRIPIQGLVYSGACFKQKLDIKET